MTVDHQERPSYLLSAVGAQVKHRFTDMLAPLGVQPPHFGVLRHLARHDGCTQQDVADDLRVRRSVMVGLLDDLERGGWVERRRHPDDRRANALHLTPNGRKLLIRCEREASRLDEALLGALPREERSRFLASLQRLGVETGVADGVYPHAHGDVVLT